MSVSRAVSSRPRNEREHQSSIPFRGVDCLTTDPLLLRRPLGKRAHWQPTSFHIGPNLLTSIRSTVAATGPQRLRDPGPAAPRQTKRKICKQQCTMMIFCLSNCLSLPANLASPRLLQDAGTGWNRRWPRFHTGVIGYSVVVVTTLASNMVGLACYFTRLLYRGGRQWSRNSPAVPELYLMLPAFGCLDGQRLVAGA